MCWYCGSPIIEPEPIGRSQSCALCKKDLRSCRNCRFYLAGARGDCFEISAEPVADKDKANFCDWFSLNPKYRSESPGQKKEMDSARAARSALDSLFS
jgi:hypothetical protein